MAAGSAPTPARGRRRVLMVARDFYPASYIACHRIGKFCKYLGTHGWQPRVLTVRAELTHGPPHDARLLEQLPAGVEIVRTFYPDPQSLRERVQRWLPRRPALAADVAEPSEAGAGLGSGVQRWLSVPDWTVYWLPWLLRRGLGLARGCDAIYATAPPKGVALVAAVLARLARRPLVIDFRDPWFLERTTVHPTRLHRLLDDQLERFSIRTAHTVVMNTGRARDAYVRRYPGEPEEKFVTIPNGFDPDDYETEGEAPTRDPERITFAYFGSLYFRRDPRPLLRAARAVQDERGERGRRISVAFWSPNRDVVTAAARDEGAEAVTRLSPRIPHREAVRAMLAADVLVLIGDPDTDELHVAGKLYEYVYCRRPILALVEEGAISDVIDRYRLGLWCSPRDSERLASHLRALVAHAESGAPWEADPDAFRDFDRRRQAGRLAELLERATSARCRRACA